MRRFTATQQKGGCQVCGVHFGGPWLACSELCWFLLNAEEQLAGETVEMELHSYPQSGDHVTQCVDPSEQSTHRPTDAGASCN
ncbi:hypothetical protein ACFL59_15065 [Planctomycetota bacterium]